MLNDGETEGETVELIVSARGFKERINEVRWVTLVLWTKGGALCSRQVGELDQVSEEAFVNAESGDERYVDWERVT